MQAVYHGVHVVLNQLIGIRLHLGGRRSVRSPAFQDWDLPFHFRDAEHLRSLAQLDSIARSSELGVRGRSQMLMPGVLGRRGVDGVFRHVGGVIADAFETA